MRIERSFRRDCNSEWVVCKGADEETEDEADGEEDEEDEDGLGLTLEAVCPVVS